MKRELALLLLTAAAVSSTSCCWGLVGINSAEDWSTPSGMVDPARYEGWDVGTVFIPPYEFMSAGYSQCSGDGGTLAFPYFACDLGMIRTFDSDIEPWPSCEFWLRPVVESVIGVYSWSKAPDSPGLLTGLSLGLRAGSIDRMVTLKYGRLTLHDTFGDGDTRLRTVTVSILWPEL